ncbi:hypothetical protein [Fretibacterium sp. OH1220_COT-178]|uniref:hypothetical protein n=1 Tax=Fretibacterium sp. OH1220_COT-178 TaxID=2491047 RepID=UPI001F466C59|nr:hypothetical protein [Fretibacterium sp. OH1220_COT-178]
MPQPNCRAEGFGCPDKDESGQCGQGMPAPVPVNKARLLIIPLTNGSKTSMRLISFCDNAARSIPDLIQKPIVRGTFSLTAYGVDRRFDEALSVEDANRGFAFSLAAQLQLSLNNDAIL